jgi:PIN domain nuclease of toxin-antitoxin system
MTDLLLDTHVWIWLSLENHTQISRAAKKAIDSTRQKWLSAISCWELAKLVEKNRIGFSIPTLSWIRRSLQENDIRIAELSPVIAVESTLLRGFHKDPADQIIAATSRILEMPLITSDKKILDFSDVETVW